MGHIEIISLIFVVLSLATIIAGIFKRRKEKKDKRIKLLLILLPIPILLIAIFKFLVPLYPPIPVSGEAEIATTQRFYTYSFAEERWQTAPGKREIPIEIWHPETAPAQKKPLLLFSHGANGVLYSNESLYRELASHGYVCISMAHPGHSFFSTLSDGKNVFIDQAYMKEVGQQQNSQDLSGTLQAL